MHRCSTCLRLVITLMALSGISLTQTSQKTRSLVINGHTGDATIYEIDGKSFVELESLIRIANGSMSFRGTQIVLTFPAADSAVAPLDSSRPASGLSGDFMRTSVQCLSILREWTGILAYAAQHGTPGDGSRIALIQGRANEALRLTKVAASSNDDQSALQLVTNQFNNVKSWSDKLISERKNMNTGKYSMTENAMSQDETYQKINTCAKFLDTMLPGGHFQDDSSCH